MIIVYILAGIGGVCVVCAFVLIAIAVIAEKARGDAEKKNKRYLCALTGNGCIYTAEKEGACYNCPVSERAYNGDAGG